MGTFIALVEKIRTAIPEIALSTDILSGFCGETDADHEKTIDALKKIRFDSAFMFSYSQRGPTLAAKKMENNVPAQEKKRRLSEIIAVQEQISREVFCAQIDRTERVLVHEPSKRNPQQMKARTDGFKTVIVDDADARPGEFLDVRINNATMATLFGSVVRSS